MRKKIFLFLTPDGITYSSCRELYPDVENLQVLGWAEGLSEEEAFNSFLKNNKWIYETKFREVICIEIKYPIYKGKKFFINTQKDH